MRAVHWKPRRGEVSFQIPSPVTGKSQAMGPMGELMAAEPEQLCPRIWPAVRKFRSGVKEAGKSWATCVDRLFGRACCMNSRLQAGVG